MSALFRQLPALAERIAWQPLGDWPTPIARARIAGREVWIKCEGASHPAYGGNKVRTLEAWFGHARAVGATTIWAIGAYGSNHALATAIHAPRAGLRAAAIVFPQPTSEWARANAAALVAHGCEVRALRSIATLPIAWARAARRGGAAAIVMPPGGATPIGAVGAVSAAFELAEQVAAGALPAPRRIVVPTGSTCTAAGLVAGLQLARAIGAWRAPVPRVHAVRVTPWPITSRTQIAQLARATLARIEALGGPAIDHALARILATLTVDGRELGDGYGWPTERGRAATAAFAMPELALDGVYAAKAAAALVRLVEGDRDRGDARDHGEPLLLWASKSTAPLAVPTRSQLAAAPRVLTRWLARE